MAYQIRVRKVVTASVINIALSGIGAVGKRVEATASNIANMYSISGYDGDGQIANVPYQPVEVSQSSNVNGGVATSLKAITPPTVPVYDPSNSFADASGVVQYPNVDPAEEAMNLILARNSYRAAVSTIQANNEITASVLNIVE
jgi:flagellar basal-body rod protein FlgC